MIERLYYLSFVRVFNNRVSPLEYKNSLSNLSLYISLSLGAEVSFRFR